MPSMEVMLGLRTDSPSHKEFPERRSLLASKSLLSNSSPSASDELGGSLPRSPCSGFPLTALGSR